MVGGIYRAGSDLALALAGAPFDAIVRSPIGPDRRLTVPQSFTLSEGEELRIGGTPRGLRAYLAARGGWQVPMILGSRSTESPLKAGDILLASPGTVAARRPSDSAFSDPTAGPIRLLDGPDGRVPDLLLADPYRVGGSSDRVGLRLEGPGLDGLDLRSRPSAPVAPGAVQVAGGRVLILGVAGGTMGGYPYVAHVIAADLDRLGQARPGDLLKFSRVDLAEARALDRARRGSLASRDRRIALGSGAPTAD
jgi:allophanate hydrolase subunit 2